MSVVISLAVGGIIGYAVGAYRGTRRLEAYQDEEARRSNAPRRSNHW